MGHHARAGPAVEPARDGGGRCRRPRTDRRDAPRPQPRRAGHPLAELPGVLAGQGSKIQQWVVFENRLPVRSSRSGRAPRSASPARFSSPSRATRSAARTSSG
ncbi:hypothetical protein NKG05_10445 [Oerskovia sp. M15]